MDINTMFSRARLDDREVNELLGLAKGIIADDIVNQREVEFLQNWLIAHLAVRQNPVICILLERVKAILDDGRLGSEEAQELFSTLRNFSAGDIEIGELLKATTLPFDSPPPDILFSGQRFCFTGTFAFGGRNDCEAAVRDRGGVPCQMTHKTNYLVIGIYSTDSWSHSAFGRKIEQAVEWRDAGVPIAIIGEDHWQASL